MPTLEKYLGKVYLWHYVPSLPAALVFTGLFALATIAHIWKMARTRMWFCLPFVIGGILEVIGYVTRAIAYNATGELIPYLLQGIFLLLPPVLFAMSLYMVYSRIVRAVHGEKHSPITPRWTTWIFVAGDWTCLNVQGCGGGLLGSKTPSTVDIGNYIIVAGLGLQVVIFAAFMWICITWNMRFRKHVAETSARSNIPWQSVLNMLYSTSLAILVRSIFRMAEFIMGQDGYLLQHEWPTYAFDGALMLIVMVDFYVRYPSQLRNHERESMLELVSSNCS